MTDVPNLGTQNNAGWWTVKPEFGRSVPMDDLGDLWTEPLSRSTLARYFRERRSTTGARLRAMVERGAAKEFAGRFQVRLREMPVEYWIDRDLVRIDPNGTNGLPDPSHDSEN